MLKKIAKKKILLDLGFRFLLRKSIQLNSCTTVDNIFPQDQYATTVALFLRMKESVDLKIHLTDKY